jgi:pimeloyl-ACP methyl ester carboxylesterase
VPEPSLTRHDPEQPSALVLMLHGGRADGLDAVDDRSASWRRSRWMMTHLTGRANRAGVGLWLLRYGVRGWNAGGGPAPSPVPDARWALDEVRREHGDVPVVLLGHSMGARTAVAVADDPSVTGVVALAPWLPAGEPHETLRDKHLAAAHGGSDRITSARATRAFVRGAERVTASAEFHDMGRVGHYMFRNVAGWNEFAISRSLAFIDASARSGR